MWDKMKITNDLRLGTMTLELKGIVDYARQTTVVVREGVADHVLVIFSCPISASWVQPLAWLGNKGRGALGSIV